MGRLGWLALMLGLIGSGQVMAQGCDGVEPSAVAARVPYLATSMRQSAEGGGLRFVHADDQRLRLSIAVAPAAPVDPTLRKSEFLTERRQSLQETVSTLPADATARTSVGYADPVSWTVQVRTPAGDDVISRGLINVKLRPTCDMVIRWEVLETQILVGRIKDMNAAIDELRTGVGFAVPSVFVPENSTPTGVLSLVLGLLFPMLAAGGFSYVFRTMLKGPRPPATVRALAGVAALATLAAIAVQLQVYQANWTDLRYADNAMVLSVAALGLAVTAVTGVSLLSLPTLSFALSSGIALGVTSYFGWAPMQLVTTAMSLLLTAVGGFGTWLWSAYPARARVKAARAKAARQGTPAVRTRPFAKIVPKDMPAKPVAKVRAA